MFSFMQYSYRHRLSSNKLKTLLSLDIIYMFTEVSRQIS